VTGNTESPFATATLREEHSSYRAKVRDTLDCRDKKRGGQKLKLRIEPFEGRENEYVRE
jgi:hypothetical protein